MKALILSFFSLDFESSISMQNIGMTDIGYLQTDDDSEY